MNKYLKIKLKSNPKSSKNKAILLHVPKDMVSGLKVDTDGVVDTKSLLGMIMMLEQDVAFNAACEAEPMTHLEIMLCIYDKSRAVDFNHKVK